MSAFHFQHHLAGSMYINRNYFPVKITCRYNQIELNPLANENVSKLDLIKLPLRVRLSNSVPRARSSWLHALRKLSALTISPPLSLVLELLLLLALPPHIPIPMLFSNGVTALILHISFNALAFNVAAPLRAAYIKKGPHW